jgi:hypothetical protein
VSAYRLDPVAFAETLLEIADKHGTAPALATLGENWARLDSPAAVTPLLHHWAKGYSLDEVRRLLMTDTDRLAESLLRFPGHGLPVYRVGYTAETAERGLVWHRLRRKALAHAHEIGAGFLAVGVMRPKSYAALKFRDAGRSIFLVLPESAPAVLRVDVIGGRRDV